MAAISVIMYLLPLHLFCIAMWALLFGEELARWQLSLRSLLALLGISGIDLFIVGVAVQSLAA
jgi:hypothetical protein